MEKKRQTGGCLAWEGLGERRHLEQLSQRQGSDAQESLGGRVVQGHACLKDSKEASMVGPE